MKRFNELSISRCLTMALALLVAAACQKETVSLNVGKDRISEEDFQSSMVFLRSRATGGEVAHSLLTEGGTFAIQEIYASTTSPLAFDQTVLVDVAPELVEPYAASRKMEYTLLPAPFYEIQNHGILTIKAGSKLSGNLQVKLYATNPVGNTLEAGRYLLPLRVKATAQDASEKVIYLSLKVRKPFEGHAPLYTGDDAFFVFYINTADYDPRLVTDYLLDKDGPDPEKCWYCTIGNLINLRRATVGYDAASGRAIFDLGADLRYLIEHYDTYILPLQEEGRKVCLTLEGGAAGLGFCNLSDSQIEDFVEQVRLVMDACPLDGISLWDRNAGYAKAEEKGLPPVNTISYPKLIKALKEMLGPDRLLTLADQGRPTETFWDKEASAGIEVGKYLDYAWSGYCDAAEGPQLIDPYHQGADGVSDLHPRKPIAGLDESRYGCVNYPWNPGGVVNWDEMYMSILNYRNSKSNQIMVFEDLRSNLQDRQEMSWHVPFMCCVLTGNLMAGGDYSYLFDMQYLQSLPSGTQGYGKWSKDW